MKMFDLQPNIGVQIMLFTDSGRRLYDIPEAGNFHIDINYDMYGVDELIFTMKPLMDINGVSYTIYDEERMREDFNARVRTERAEVVQAVRALERSNDERYSRKDG